MLFWNFAAFPFCLWYIPVSVRCWKYDRSRTIPSESHRRTCEWKIKQRAEIHLVGSDFYLLCVSFQFLPLAILVWVNRTENVKFENYDVNSFDLLKLIHNSWRENKGTHNHDAGFDIGSLNYHKILRTLSMHFSKNSCSFEKLFQKLRSVFHPISCLLEIGLKKSAAPRFSTYFYVSGYRMKHCVSLLVYCI